MPTPRMVDVLTVSLDDVELRLEVELLTRLILAANESASRFTEVEIDLLLEAS